MSAYDGYLDYAAATPLDERVLAAMHPFLTDQFANPGSPHARGRRVQEALEAARRRIAHCLGAKPAEIIFASGSTEAAYLAILGLAHTYGDARVAVSSIEHEAVLRAATQAVGDECVDMITADRDGIIQPAALRMAIHDASVLVCVQYVNNEIGSLQPIAKLAAVVAEVRSDRVKRGIDRPLYFYCDAAQAGLMNLAVSRLGVDMLSMGGSKLYGPTGSGFLYLRTGVVLDAPMIGGGQEHGLRGGTENVAAAVGLATALELVQQGRQDEGRRQAKLRGALWADIQRRIPEVIINGSLDHRHPGNLNVTIPGCDGETLVAHLDVAGFAVATGSACTAANQEPSHVLRAIGRSDGEAESSLRITTGRHTTHDEIDRFGESLEKCVANVRALTLQQRNPVQ